MSASPGFGNGLMLTGASSTTARTLEILFCQLSGVHRESTTTRTLLWKMAAVVQVSLLRVPFSLHLHLPVPPVLRAALITVM